MKLHHYFRSGTSHRTRIALALKGVGYESIPVDLRSMEQKADAFRALNPQALVPALEVGGDVLTQSPAILEWLEETHPEPPLLPREPNARAKVRAIAAAVACDIHPLGNMRVLVYLSQHLGADPGTVKDWALTWITDGFNAIEAMVSQEGPWCWGGAPTLADCTLVPQLYAAISRYDYTLAPHPRLAEIYAAAEAHPAFQAAHPDRWAN